MASLRQLPGPPETGRCLVMGVLNVTPDSFSDGGRWLDPKLAIEHGLRLADEGADIVDVGGESTRPGAQRVSYEEEMRRVEPVVTELVRQGVPLSIDTMRAKVAGFAVDAGVRLINDVSGGLADPEMAGVVAETGVPYVVMHWRGHSQDMQSRAVYTDVVREVREELQERVAALGEDGVDPRQVVLDPGLGFAKRADREHNWQLLARLSELVDLGHPLLVAASRKRFLARLLSDSEGEPRAFADCDAATLATTALAAERGAWCVRVHDVPGNADAVRVAAAWRSGGVTLRDGRGEPIGWERP